MWTFIYCYPTGVLCEPYAVAPQHLFFKGYVLTGNIANPTGTVEKYCRSPDRKYMEDLRHRLHFQWNFLNSTGSPYVFQKWRLLRNECCKAAKVVFFFFLCLVF